MPRIISSIRQTYSNMFLFLGWYYKLANVLGNIAGGPHTFPLAGQETLQVAQWSAWFRLGKWVGSRRVYIYILQLRQFGGFYHLIYPLGMCSSAAVVSYHTDARVTLSGKNTEVYPSLTNIYPRAPGFQTYWHGGIKKYMLNHVGAFWWIHSCRILSLPFCFTCLCSPHVIMNGDSIYTTTASNSGQWPIFRWWSNGYFPIVPEVGTQPNHWPVRMYVTYMTEGSLEVKLPTIWTDEKTEVGRVREENQKEKEDQRRERVRRHKRCRRAKR